MAEIADLERRITAALDRIGAGVDNLELAKDMPEPVAPEPDPEVTDKLARFAAMEAHLSDERLANAQLEERVKGLKDRQERHLTALEIQVTEQQRAASKLDGELQRLKAAAEQLRESNIALREANIAGLAEPHLINKAMLAELETLRAARGAEIAEAGAIITSLEPLIKRAAQDTSSEKDADHA